MTLFSCIMTQVCFVILSLIKILKRKNGLIVTSFNPVFESHELTYSIIKSCQSHSDKIRKTCGFYHVLLLHVSVLFKRFEHNSCFKVLCSEINTTFSYCLCLLQ